MFSFKYLLINIEVLSYCTIERSIAHFERDPLQGNPDFIVVDMKVWTLGRMGVKQDPTRRLLWIECNPTESKSIGMLSGVPALDLKQIHDDLNRSSRAIEDYKSTTINQLSLHSPTSEYTLY